MSTLEMQTVPNKTFEGWIISNYFDVLEESLQELNLSKCQISFLVEEEVSTDNPNNYRLPESVPAPPDDLSWKNHIISNYGNAEIVEPIERSLNPKYTFDTFILGSCNRFAHAAALAVVDMPSKTYNPLYIYSGEIEERTHLLHAIGNAIINRNRSIS